MAGWQDRAVERSFKPAEGGYLFQCPNPWLFGRMRSYLVNEDQKERLAACLRLRQRAVLWLMGIYLLMALGLTWLFASAGPSPDPVAAGFLPIVALFMLVMFGLAMAPHLYLMRKIKPVLAEVETADKTTLREQIVGVAMVISNLNLGLGGLGRFLIVVSNVKTIAEELSAGRIGSQVVLSGLGLLAGAALMGYFGYLALLKRKLQRNAK
jgi:hypothetical protein